ncbi:oxygenase [Lithospermum erythrorhizon]|uniref:22alpha-hydroxysteroid 23-monooxygenase n=1 Tax=Lithospermum erythrorhizon TaxID=34254 RepID=A0AAV3PSI3_LITER
MDWLFLDVWFMVISLVLVSIWWVIHKEIRRKKKEKEEEEMEKGIPRGSSGWPLIGETLEFIASGYTSRPVSFMDKRKAIYGKVFKTHILGKPIIVSTDAEVNKVILQNHGNVFIPSYPKSITELLGKSSILQMNGYLQKRVHSLIGGFLRSPHFKARITKDIQNSVQRSMSTWLDQKQQIYLQDETKKITFEVLVKVLMSIGPGEDLKFFKTEFEEFIKGLICLPIKFPGTRLYKSLKAKERLVKKVKGIIEERKMSMDKPKDEGVTNDAVDVLLKDTDDVQGQLPLDFMSGNIIEMMIPGEETVPTATTLAVKYLSDTPAALARMVEENMDLMKRKAESSEEYCWNDYLSLKFTQNVISETLRMANIINAVWRKSLKDVKIKEHLIPKGYSVLASFSSVHMDDQNYENPYEFNPWRWEKTGSTVNIQTFTPFGGGQRLCPGLELSRLEISIFLHHFVTKFRWVAENDEVVYFPTVRMKRKLPITIIPRLPKDH